MGLEYLNPTMDKLLKSFKLDKAYTRAEGLYLFDDNGNRYLDFISQYGSVPFGYSPAEIIEEAKSFLDSRVPTMVQPSVPIKAVELAELLLHIAPGQMKQVTFCQSGAEAVEVAIKLARSTTKKKKILSTTNSFHGKTMGALSATGREVYQKPFFVPTAGFEYIPFGDLESLEHQLKRESAEIAAFLVEPIQGEGGIIIPSEGYLKKAETLCKQHEVLLIVDEIQTGLGRTGQLFACDREKVEPDILLISKALGGGIVPLGACLSTKEAWNEEFGRLHSSTFANNNFTCTIGLAVLKKLLHADRQLLTEVNERSSQLLNGLKMIKGKYSGVIKDVRGSGLMAGLEFNLLDASGSFSIKYMVEQGGFSPLISGYLLHNLGIRCAPFLNNPMTLRLQPSLTVSEEQVQRAITAVEQIAEILYYQDFCELYSHLFGWTNWSTSGPRNFRSSKKPVLSSETTVEELTKEKFAFLIHYPAAEDVVKNNPSFDKLKKEELEQFLDWEAEMASPPDVIVHMPAIRSKAGKVAEGWLIGVPYSGRHLIEMPRKDAVAVLEQAVHLAKELGAKIVGLGAYTSVVSRGGSDLLGKGVAITSGNSYTVATAFEALLEGAKMMSIDTTAATGSVIGATGAIGSVCAFMLAEEVEQLYLVGNPAKEKTSIRRLERLAEEIYQRAFNSTLDTSNELLPLKGIARWIKNFLSYLEKKESGMTDSVKRAVRDDSDFSFLDFINKNLTKSEKWKTPPIKVTVNIQQALMRSDLIITASNSTSHLIGPGHLKPGSVVCDVARPADVSKAVLETRKDVLVIEGGLVRYPECICFGQNMGYDPGVNLACLSETMLLALEGDYRDFSIGLKLSLDEINYLKVLAEKHGFKLAMPRNERGKITSRIVTATRKAACLDSKVTEKLTRLTGVDL